MKERRLCYISRTYYNQTSAGNKAKTDYEKVLHSMGTAISCKEIFFLHLQDGTPQRSQDHFTDS